MLLFCTKLQKVTLVVFPVKMTGLRSISYKSVIMLYYHQLLDLIFCQLVFFHLGLVLCFYLHLINRKPHLSESRYLVLSEKSIFYE